ncbi:hypothetical protein E0H35_06415 [Rhizobium leguminosarum bv. viciae]|uniref:hypothetical protein n=1 Tax=Rhizobium leguminosarum TaxID=384 RepID=UPI00103127F2|nr:hypothetical protein [Rhizobium leguminosarum]MBY5341190.1 hypothetical protein [Rhizobium leguminosarum]NKK50875.1 hypothetical protein [Rhizobium leguminosarum bv. viciae]TBG74484.1 hypothetical protein ELG69_29615 [Rhizobium leguminosarum]TBZ02515.1 hypothetical protein E0H35_06415 [Rhizobium leguminosarum bv. viciae]
MENRPDPLNRAAATRQRSFWPATAVEWIEAVVKLSIVAGGLFAIFQFLDGKQTERVKATLQYVSRFENEDSAANRARRALSDALRVNAGNLQRLGSAHVSTQQASALKQKLASTILEDADDDMDVLLELDGFFNSLQICVRNEICDRNTSLEYFNSYANWLVGNFGEIIDERANRASGFGRGIKWIAGGVP